MILPAPFVTPLVEALAGTLDRQIELLSAKRRLLEELFDALWRRQNAAVETILAAMEQANALQQQIDGELTGQRRELGEAIGCPAGHLRLAMVLDHLADPLRRQVQTRRQRLLEATEALRRQHMATALLLTEASRVNRLLLETVLPAAQPLVTYGARGAEAWRSGGGLLDSEA